MKQVEGNKCFYKGKPYPLMGKVDPAVKKVSISFDGNVFMCSSPSNGEIDCTNALRVFYTKACKKIIDERIKLYQPLFNVKPRSFVIDGDSKKWGSCNSNRHLTFHYRLACFPLEAIDYVVIHEMCHMLHMNHDRSFWRLVGKLCPKYKEAMAILGTEKTRDL